MDDPNLVEDSKSPRPSSVFDSDDDATDSISPLLLPLTVTIDEDGGQLSAPQKNSEAELSIPRRIISSGKSSSLLQAELLGPVFAGTYLDNPAYLVRLQLQLSLSGGNQSWLSRIQTAKIRVLIEDAPRDGAPGLPDDDDDDDADNWEPAHPAIIKAFPGPSGWEGSRRSAEVTTTSELGVQVGYDPVSISYNVSESRARVETGAVKVRVAHKGPRHNILLVLVEENAVDKAGVPDHLVIPFVIAHRSRRFRMRITIHARFGLWRGKPADMVPILGRADEPLYFDPLVMRRVMERGRRGVNGERVVEWRGALNEITLQDYSSLGDETATRA